MIHSEPSDRSVHPFENLFDQIYIINLSTRPDRWETIQSRLKKEGINTVKRVEAVNGRVNPYYQSWHTLTTKVFRGQHKLFSPGSYGYLLSMYRIFNDALQQGYQKILVLDDDIAFHREANYHTLLNSVPENWKILYFGYCHKGHSKVSQSWNIPGNGQFIDIDTFLHKYGKGSINGSFFMGYHHSVFESMMKYISNSRVPFDTGPLRLCYRTFKNVYITHPPVAIAQIEDSDIQSDTNNQHRLLKDWRWDNSKYKW